MAKFRVSFPHIGNYCVPLKLLFNDGLNVEYIIPPPITKKTLELGSRHSPDYVCSPFKYNLGNYIETIEVGANTLVQAGGPCRLGYYGELHEQILADFGYSVRFVNMAGMQITKPLFFYNKFREINPGLSLKKIAGILPLVIRMVEDMDQVEDFIRKNRGFETIPGSFDKVHANYLGEISGINSRKQLRSVSAKYMKMFRDIEVCKPKNPLRVGVIGEYYTIMEPFSNHYIEKELARMGIVVDRWMNITNSMFRRRRKKIKERIRKYAKFSMGATSMFTIDRALEFARQGFDGIIHVKSFGCTPEMDALPVLQNISTDYKIPILYFSFDSQTSDTGIQTRLEAFHDMIVMRNEGKR